LRRSSLEELGAKYKSQHANFSTKSDFEIGCMTAVVRLEQIMKILTTNSIFKGRYLTALAEENASLMAWDGQDHGVRKVMLQNSHILFSGNPGSIKWCLGKTYLDPKDFIKEFMSLKPCVIGSDAHELNKLGIPPNGKFTWIKADTTFDGLKQIIYEAEDRVFIGTTPPDEKDNAKVIKSLAIKDGSGWLADQIIAINRDLTAVIGGKGSGKTALMDLLACVGGDFDSLNKEAFLNKAKEEIAGTKLTLTWADDSTTVCEVHDGATYPKEPKIRYLSQSFVENLCSFDQHEKLVRQIENILFQYVAPERKMKAKDFGDLKAIKTRSIQLEIDKISMDLKKLNGEIFTLETELAGKDELVNELIRLTKEQNDLNVQKPVATNPEEQKEQEQLQTLREKKSKLEEMIEEHRVKISQIEEFRTRSKLLAGEIEAFNADIKVCLKDFGLEKESAALAFEIPARLDEILKKRISEVEKIVQSLEGRGERKETTPPSAGPADTLDSVEKQIKEIEEKSKLEAQRKRKLIEFGKRISEITKRIETLNKAVEALDTTKKVLLADKTKDRDTEYFNFFKKLNEKKTILEELYKPLNEPAGSSSERGKVQFYARSNFNISRFVSEGIHLFDGRRSVIRGDSALAEVAQEFWKQVQKLLPDMNIEPMQNLLSVLQNSAGNFREIKSQLKGDFKQSDVYDWLYRVDYFDVEYGIKYEGVDLDKLSPGRKGVVLLLIYLDVDKDFRPLLIDQPEENLDNRSVYSTLVEYFRKAKRKRQIILVTHNANLVVNSDAEQIIVANFDLDTQVQGTKIEYVCGSLEFKLKPDLNVSSPLLRQGIREHVCEILEGGDEAFQRREHKYGFVR
jgi:energy-coupling factor transporter ATP-binding protein EcfA2